MFQVVDNNNPYKEWLRIARLLDPPYDYFNFAETCYSDMDKTNWKKNPSTRFHSLYSSYWEERHKAEEERALRENEKYLKKRTLGALQEINEDIIENMVSTSKQLTSITNEKRRKTQEIHTLYEEMTGQKALYLDDEGVSHVMNSDILNELKNKTNLKEYNLTEATASLINLITQRPKSITDLRKTIKDYKLPPDESYDPVIHADITFTENTGLYFIDLALSPRNPLLFKTLERTAAIHTSIFLLNSLFLSVNDKISFNWIEIETLLTQKSKWDGVGFCPTMGKVSGDIKKIEKGVIDFIEYTESNIGHLARYHNLQLYFEVITLIDGAYARRSCATIKFPTTPDEFVSFFKEIPNLSMASIFARFSA